MFYNMQRKTKHTLETRAKMSLAAYTRDNTRRLESLPKGSKHWNWKDKPTILGLHKRIHRRYGSAKMYLCSCGKTAKDWAFVGRGLYTDNRDDYEPKCRKCHIQMDKPHEKRAQSCYQRNRDTKGRFIKSN